MLAEDATPTTSRSCARMGGYRSVLTVPMMRGDAHGRSPHPCKAEPFAESRVALLQTFARAGGDRDRERAPLQRARGAQPRARPSARAADGDRRDPRASIASSPTDVQPVFDAAPCQSAEPLTGGVDGHQPASSRSRLPTPRTYDASPNRYVRSAPALVPRSPTADARGASDPRSQCRVHIRRRGLQATRSRPRAMAQGYRSAAGVPLLRDGEAIGAIVVTPPRGRAASPTQHVALPRDLRRPGGDRDRERAPVQRAEAQQRS